MKDNFRGRGRLSLLARYKAVRIPARKRSRRKEGIGQIRIRIRATVLLPFLRLRLREFH